MISAETVTRFVEDTSSPTDDERMRNRAPWYARAIGVPLILFGVLNGVGFFLLPPDQWGTSREIVMNVAGILLTVVGGSGLLFSRRWGWGLALVATVLLLGTGVLAVIPPPDVAFPADNMIALVVLILPSLAGSAALLAPATLRWVRKRPSEREAVVAGA